MEHQQPIDPTQQPQAQPIFAMGKANKSEEAFELLLVDVNKIIKEHEQKNMLLRPQAGPVIVQEDGFYIIRLLLWPAPIPTFFISAMPDFQNHEMENCNHSAGYHDEGGGLVCKNCGKPL